MGIRINKQQIAIILFFIGTCFRWFFIGIAGGTKAEVLILFVAIILLLLQGKNSKRMINLSAIWLLYGFSVLFNVCIKGIRSTSVFLNAIMLMEILFFLLFLNASMETCKHGVRFIVIYGVINAFFVFIHFILGDKFTSFYYRFLNPDAQALSENYFKLGHYFGFFYMPADAAGLIAYAIVFTLFAAFVFNKKRKNKWMYLVFALILLIALLLTGKKGVLFCSIIAFSLVMMLLYASKRQWYKLLRYIIVGVVILIAAYLFIMTQLDNPIVARLNEFFVNLSAGEGYDSNRSVLYGYALEQWSNNKLFGIGWRQFSGLTVSLYGMETYHEVNRDYLQLLCETGIFGLVLTLIPMVVMFCRMVYIMRRMAKQEQLQPYYAIISFAGFIQLFFALYAFIEIPFYDYTFFAVYIFSCAIINKVYRHIKLIESSKTRKKNIVRKGIYIPDRM